MKCGNKCPLYNHLLRRESPLTLYRIIFKKRYTLMIVFLIGGPSGNGNKLTSGNSTLLLVISLVFGGVILAMTIAIIVGKLKKRVRQRGTEVVKDI